MAFTGSKGKLLSLAGARLKQSKVYPAAGKTYTIQDVKLKSTYSEIPKNT